jgi:hypothetical protein
MTSQVSWQEFEAWLQEGLQTVKEVPNGDFFEVSRKLGLDPLKDYGEADLSSADLSHANLAGVNFQRTNLSSADLSNANLQNANLGYANLQGANLQGANLQQADLSHANLEAANLQGAIVDAATRFPKALDLSAFGLIGLSETAPNSAPVSSFAVNVLVPDFAAGTPMVANYFGKKVLVTYGQDVVVPPAPEKIERAAPGSYSITAFLKPRQQPGYIPKARLHQSPDDPS